MMLAPSCLRGFPQRHDDLEHTGTVALGEASGEELTAEERVQRMQVLVLSALEQSLDLSQHDELQFVRVLIRRILGEAFESTRQFLAEFVRDVMSVAVAERIGQVLPHGFLRGDDEGVTFIFVLVGEMSSWHPVGQEVHGAE